MATPTEVSHKVELLLRGIRAALEDLPSLVEDQERDKLGKIERDVLSMEWDNDMWHLRTLLDPAYRSGQMTANQAECYRELLQELKEALPVIERLGFTRPSVQLEP